MGTSEASVDQFRDSNVAVLRGPTVSLEATNALQLVCASMAINANEGGAGNVLTSQGPGLAPIWAPVGAPDGVRQAVSSFSGVRQTVTTILPVDGTIPQNTEGTEIYSVTITPQSATSNLLVIATVGARSPTVSSSVALALFRDSTVDSFGAQTASQSANQGGFNTMVQVIPSTAAVATTIKLRAGPSIAGTLYINGYTGPVTYFGGVAASGLIVIEYGA